jgi:hypothetical protein
MQIVTSIKAALPTLKADFLKAETWIKTTTVAIVTGASADVIQLLHTGHEILFTHAGIVLLEHTFLGGAVVSVIGLFTKSPLTAKATTPIPTPEPVPTPTV